MNIVFGTVYYSKAKKYAKQFLSSLEGQTTNNFTLLVINDSNDKAEEIFESRRFKFSIKTVQARRRSSAAVLRGLLIRKACKLKADILILGDIDDCFSPNRVEESARFINSYDFLYNNIILMDNRGKIISNNIFAKKASFEVNNYKDILNKNMIGLGSLCLNLRKLNLRNIRIPAGIISVDWWLVTRLLLSGKKGIFLKNALTYYRQHEDNHIGAGKILNDGLLKKGLESKIRHYRYFSRLGYKDYSKRLNQMRRLRRSLNDPFRRKEYISLVNRKFRKERPVWWENILTLEEVGR